MHPRLLSSAVTRPLNFTVRLLVKRLLLLGAVVTFVASVNAEPPPRLPFESVDWPASLKHEPSKGVTLGALRVTFETTTLSEVQKAASTGAIAYGGKGGDSMSWLCYSIRGVTVWIGSGSSLTARWVAPKEALPHLRLAAWKTLRSQLSALHCQ